MGSILNLVYDDVVVKKSYYEDVFTRFTENYSTKLFHINDISENSEYEFFYVYSHYDYIFEQIRLHKGLPFSDIVIYNLKTNPKFHFIFLNEMESDTENCLQILENELIISGYNPKQIHIINANQKLPELKIKYNSNLNIGVSNLGLYVLSKHLQIYRHEYNIDREHLFMFYNRNVKPHRVATLCFLKKLGILDNVDWSWLRGSKFNEVYNNTPHLKFWFEGILDDMDMNEIKDELIFLKDIQIKKSIHEDYVVDVPPNFVDWDIMYKMNPYRHSYVNIVCETNYIFNEIVLLSEKCIIPLYFYQIPIVFSSYNHIKYLKEKYDFDFFDDIIDHSYDNEIDNRKRFFMVMDEIKKINTKKDDIVQYFKNNFHRFQKNREIIIKLSESKESLISTK